MRNARRTVDFGRRADARRDSFDPGASAGIGAFAASAEATQRFGGGRFFGFGPDFHVPEPAAEPPQPAHAFVSAGIGTSFGKVPFFSYGPQFQVVFKPKGFWGLELSAGALGGSGVELPGSGTIDFLLLEGGGALCPLESLHEGLLLRGCGGFTVGWLRAESHDLEPNRRRTEVVFSPDLHVQVAQSIGKGFFVGGGLAAAFPIRPNQYAYRDADGVGRVAFQMSVPSLNLNLFLARVFP